MMPRISLTLLLIFSAVALPWWVSLFLLIFSLAYFPWYYEGALAALFYQLLYGLTGTLWLPLIVLITIPMIEWLKKRLYVFT